LSVLAVSAHAADTANPLWEKACDGTGRCWVEQFAISMPDRLVALHIRFDQRPDGAVGMAVAAPLGVALRPGQSLALDGAAPISLPFERCGERGCDAIAVLDKVAVEKIMKSKSLLVHYVVSDTASADIPVRLEGLKDALTTLSR
jgi:invasion protein IalB